MKYLVLAALFACAIAAPSRPKMVFPRLPPSILRDEKFMIPEDKIVGGKEVTANSLPFQISMQRQGALGFSQYCGGSILTAKTILNAAHCVDGINVNNFRIVAGEHDLNAASGKEQIRSISSYKMHESWDTSTNENDIALIYLSSALDLSVSSASAVKLPASLENPAAGTMLTVSGWGTTSSGGSTSDVLLSVNVPVVSDTVCNDAYSTVGNRNPIVASMLCAGDMKNGGIDSCQGDSGGPLFSGTGANAVQHGVVSWGQGCAVAAYPGVYTQVSYFLDWIAKNQQ